MKKKKSVSVVISVLTLAGFYAPGVFAQVIVSCSQGLSIGNNIQCSKTAKLLINPDGSTNVTSGCLFSTSPRKAGQCSISTGGTPPTKNVVVDFAKSFVNIINGGKQVKIDTLRMQYKPSISPASKFTFTKTAVINGINLDIGGTAHVTTTQGIGTYSGHITIRAN